MKRFYLFALAAMVFAACATDDTQDLRPMDAPETLTVGFEGGDDDTRVQLNEAGKTVWTKGDLVSVFYRSDANQKWQFQGETGERAGTIKRASAPEYTHTTSKIVVAYPYNENYYLNPETCNLQAYLPAEQNYLKDSYGLNGNIMVSSSEYKQFTLKSVCGWLKLQLTGSGEMVHSITLKGNNGEQVAGEIYIHTADATSILAAEQGGFGDDTEIGGTMLEDDTILTEVVLNCGNGVELGSVATAFYIALPPQTFEKGLKVEIATTDGKTMTKSTDKSLAIERNTIQPMAVFNVEIEKPDTPDTPDTPTLPTPANNEIYYTNGSTTEATAPNKTDVFGANIVSNLYDAEKSCWVIKFDGDVTKIEYEAFYNCTSLTSITIPNSVTKIGADAFGRCSSLTSITIPNSVTLIGNHAFWNCTSLTSVTIPDSITHIVDGVFSFCSSLANITIPDSVTSIGSSAFSDCKSLTSVTIPNSVTKIGADAFSYCNSLKEVYCKSTTPPTGDSNMFFDNASGRKIYVPASDDDSIINAYKAKEYWSKYADYIFEEGESAPANNEIWYTATEKVVPYKSDGFGANIVSNEWYETTGKGVITFDGEVTSIGAGAFAHCYALESINIPNSVIRIDQEAFVSSGLKAINIPDSVTSIGSFAFSDCTSLTSATIPDSVTSIGGYAFANCPSLTSVTIPNGVTKIGEWAFYYCSSLTSVTIPDSVMEIGEGAFESCTSLKAFYGKFATTDNRCLIVNGTLNAFAIGCGATSYTIPNSVTSIGGYAFINCTSLTSVTIPDSVTSIGYSAFLYCTSLKTVYCKPTTPPTGDSGMFSSNASGRKIYVPASDDDSIISAYKAKSYWSNYKSYIFEYDFSAEQ